MRGATRRDDDADAPLAALGHETLDPVHPKSGEHRVDVVDGPSREAPRSPHFSS
jgi:hypothetical protein